MKDKVAQQHAPGSAALLAGLPSPNGPATSGALFTALFDALPDAVWVADAAMAITYINPALRELLELSLEARPADAALRLAALCDRDGQPLAPEEQPLRRALRGEAAAGLPLRLPRLDDEADLHLRVSFAPLHAGTGIIAGAIVQAGDRTAQYQIERARDDFLVSVAHDLRSPLTAIRGGAQLALRGLNQETLNCQALERSLQMIDAAAGRLNRMLETLMDSARLDRGDLSPQCVPTDLTALVQEVVEHHRRESTRHTFLLNTPEEPLIGNWDASLLERAIENLVGNAVKYSPDGGEVVVICADKGDCARFTVRDHGIGIPAAGLAHIFDRFFRARNASFGEVEGNGLGLFAVKGIISSHGGTTSVQTVEGEGTEISVLLPRRGNTQEYPRNTNEAGYEG